MFSMLFMSIGFARHVAYIVRKRRKTERQKKKNKTMK